MNYIIKPKDFHSYIFWNIHIFRSVANWLGLFAADARQRIVSERVDMIHNVVISVSVTPQILYDTWKCINLQFVGCTNPISSFNSVSVFCIFANCCVCD